MKSLDQTAPLHQMYDGESCMPFWSSGQPSQVADSKKDDTLSSWGNPQDDYYVRTSAEPKSQIVFTTRKKKINVWSFLTFCLVVMGGTTYWHLQASLRLILEQTEIVMPARNEINMELRSAEKNVRILSREVASTATLFEKQRERLLGEESNVREHADSVKQRLSEAQSSVDDTRGKVDSSQELKTALKDAVQHQSRKSVEAKYGK